MKVYPYQTLLYSAKTYDGARHAAKYAVSVPEVSFDLPKIIRPQAEGSAQAGIGSRKKADCPVV